MSFSKTVLDVKAVMTMENHRVNLLADMNEMQPFPSKFDSTPVEGSAETWRVFRHYPLSELEARSLHFTKSSPLNWIEEHMGDLLLLRLFRLGFDARNIEFRFKYIPFLVQTEKGGDGPETHAYTWTFDKEKELLTLNDNGQDIVLQPTRGPQAYLWLTEEELSIRKLGTEATETIRK